MTALSSPRNSGLFETDRFGQVFPAWRSDTSKLLGHPYLVIARLIKLDVHHLIRLPVALSFDLRDLKGLWRRLKAVRPACLVGKEQNTCANGDNYDAVEQSIGLSHGSTAAYCANRPQNTTHLRRRRGSARQVPISALCRAASPFARIARTRTPAHGNLLPVPALRVEDCCGFLAMVFSLNSPAPSQRAGAFS